MNKTNNRKSFENSWSITYRKPDYDALADPHASFYFLNRNVKKHLIHLKKVFFPPYEVNRCRGKTYWKKINEKTDLWKIKI